MLTRWLAPLRRAYWRGREDGYLKLAERAERASASARLRAQQHRARAALASLRARGYP